MKSRIAVYTDLISGICSNNCSSRARKLWKTSSRATMPRPSRMPKNTTTPMPGRYRALMPRASRASRMAHSILLMDQ